MASPYLLVGLGNPGPKYQTTRHNIGFMMLEHLARLNNCHIDKTKMQGRYCKHRIATNQVLFLLPQTYMNLSGACVRQFVDYFNVPLQNLLVIHDDIDLPCGRIKVVAKGGAGGHNGIKSIAQHLGSTAISRIKFGVGRPTIESGVEKQPVDKYVLSGFSKSEQKIIDDRASIVVDAVDIFLKQGIGPCMNLINCRAKKE
ncbi:aminoacyl-tRNA hydrolase [Desulfogranum marinum]|jgi:PTH1 family peptidyl-tRNA hydrolase|uniref:aminoacyl-tRNA hydrolase n=1 Tax=Desulfogranum marinum TaxID=453220 RepID=UPI0019652AA8|nr:aminoacyl-tRNA hydrolase [Desulfogranum marinum]MBM9510846.1 aminoacyl-tRNA hydrolase [Desulfogranum marinum]